MFLRGSLLTIQFKDPSATPILPQPHQPPKLAEQAGVSAAPSRSFFFFHHIRFNWSLLPFFEAEYVDRYSSALSSPEFLLGFPDLASWHTRVPVAREWNAREGNWECCPQSKTGARSQGILQVLLEGLSFWDFRSLLRVALIFTLAGTV